MRIDQVQAAAAAKLSASAALAAFGSPFAFDPHAEEEEQIQLFNARVQSTGAALRVGSITCPRSEETIGGVLTPLTAEGIVFFAEKKGHAHTPRALAAVAEIIRALCADQLPGEDNAFTCAGYDALETKHGHILHLVAFTHPIFVT